MRLFVASSLDRFGELDEIFLEIAHIHDSRMVKTEKLHLTFLFLGEVEETRVPDIISKLSHAHLARFTLHIHGLSAFPSPISARVLYLNVENTPEIQMNYRSIRHSLGELSVGEQFVPHITLSRFRNPVDISHLKTRFVNLIRNFEVETISLYRSILSSHGPVYQSLADFQLK